MSDGTEFLRFLDPATLAEKSRLRVTAAGSAAEEPERTRVREGRGVRQCLADRLRGAHRSCVGQGDRLHRLARPAHGAGARRTDVLNGIAYDEATDRLFITGKLWPRVFEVRITRK